MKLEYAGFRPIISQHGISFKRGKDDKFIYLPFAYEILNALNNDYDSTKNHSHSIKIEELNMEKILKIISSIYSKIDTELDEKVKSYIKHLDEEEKEVENRTTLSDIEKNIYLENLKLMRTYKIQRAKNKIFYYYCVSAIVEIIKKNKIRKIDLPFNEKFWHILKSIQSKLQSHNISSTIKVDELEGLKIKFTVNIF
ncbi:hypothetical protein [Aliarcobacter butzleri]|uniref:hypothetical protein n=1 Tax=Aliarcobacter butzleri TaxID=28197 RepID=UPI00214C8001|nr:hypothetical protein [Aliarcobacter butzleri]MCP3649298.1 hypothetical protein [Arcobacter sp. DNRA7]MCR1815471.1 hypothetical protein [Aliarcobacter butzleri]